jgi:hypothetical protein
MARQAGQEMGLFYQLGYSCSRPEYVTSTTPSSYRLKRLKNISMKCPAVALVKLHVSLLFVDCFHS